MAILKKIKASTLMETLVATVLIVVVFMVASMILNNLFSNSIKNNTREIDAQLNELQYLYNNEQISLPHHEDFKGWQITIDSYIEVDTKIVEIEAVNQMTKNTISKRLHETD